MYSTVPNHSPPVSAETPPTSNSSASPKSSTTTRPSAGDHHIGRLEVAVQAAGPMQRAKRARQLACRRGYARELAQGAPAGSARRGEPARAWRDGVAGEQAGLGAVDFAVAARGVGARAVLGAHEREEVHAVDQLHREEPLVAGADQLVQRRQVRVREVGQQAKLALEAIERPRLDLGQRLERDLDVAHAIERLIDDAHAAGAQPALDQESSGLAQRRAWFGIHATRLERHARRQLHLARRQGLLEQSIRRAPAGVTRGVGGEGARAKHVVHLAEVRAIEQVEHLDHRRQRDTR